MNTIFMSIVGNAFSIITMLWLIFRYKVNSRDLLKITFGVAISYGLAIVAGAMILSLTQTIIQDPSESLPLTMFISTLTEEFMKCAFYLIIFRGAYRVQMVVIYGLVFGASEVILLNSPYSYGSLLSSNLHFFLQPSFLLIWFYVANKEGFASQRTVLLGILLATTTHLLNNFLGEYVKWLYPYFFSALMIFSYAILRSEMKRSTLR